MDPVEKGADLSEAGCLPLGCLTYATGAAARQ
jgi:hypothetical protein